MNYKKILVILIVWVSAIYFALPNFIEKSWLPSKRIIFGLDLSGGSSILLQVDFENYFKEKFDLITNEIIAELKNKALIPNDIKNNKNHLLISFNNEANIAGITNVIRNFSTELTTSCDKANSCKIIFNNIAALKQKVLSESISTIQRRVDEFGTHEVIVQSQGDNAILVQVPGLEEPSQLKSLLGKTAKLTFHLLDEKKKNYLLKDKNGYQYPIKRKVELTGDLLNDASVSFNNLGSPVVLFKFNNAGTKKFSQISKDNVGKPFAIVLDNKVLTVPVIREPILGGRGEISGKFSLEEAQELAILLRSGSLPAPLNIIEERIVGPSLGTDSINAGTNASIISLVIISLFMLAVYGKLGICATIALLVNITIMIAFLSLIEATLTLPGIAGFVLTIGMAVDANVLIFERIKEELKHNNKLNFKIIVARGFKNAMTTILDSNITTLIAALIMFIIGIGPVKGFAVTLSSGILSSMFAAIFVTKQTISFFGQKVIK